MTAKAFEVIVMEGIAVMMFVMAYAVGVKRRLKLIAGYNDRSAGLVHNKLGLARLVARLCVLIGVVSALMPLLTHLWGQNPADLKVWIGAYGGFVAGVVTLTVVQAKDYVTKGPQD